MEPENPHDHHDLPPGEPHSQAVEPGGEPACNICGVRAVAAVTLEAGGYRCEEHRHLTASPIRADVEELLREVLAYFDDTIRVCGEGAGLVRLRGLKQRVEAVLGRTT